MALGTTFSAKSTIFGEFGVPGRFLGTALGRILAGKNWDEKHDEKKVAKAVASAGDADPGQDPPAGFFRQGSARLRSPGGRGAGGFNVLRTDRRARKQLCHAAWSRMTAVTAGSFAYGWTRLPACSCCCY